ncbi:MAG: glycosyltransferase family 87 protein [Chloroflexota bacterium]
MNGPRRLLVGALVVLLAILTVRAHLTTTLVDPNVGVDVEIPLRAADRWLAGGEPYLAQSFVSGTGADLPFLYPPFTLPLFAVLSWLPRQPVLWASVALLLGAAVVTLRRLRIPWLWVPLVVAWPPFVEGIIHANLTILLFLAFVILFYKATGSPWRADPRDVSRPNESVVEVGGLATVIGAVKASQSHAWLFVLHYRWRAAVVGAIGVVALVLLTVPVIGTDAWFDWIAQLGRASDPTWAYGGFALTRFVPPLVGMAVAVVCVVAVWFVPKHDGGPWVGLLSTVGALSLHAFGLLFMIPAMLRIRLEIALIAACMVATYSYEGAWAGIILVTAAYAGATFAPEDLRARLSDWPAPVGGAAPMPTAPSSP